MRNRAHGILIVAVADIFSDDLTQLLRLRKKIMQLLTELFRQRGDFSFLLAGVPCGDHFKILTQ